MQAGLHVPELPISSAPLAVRLPDLCLDAVPAKAVLGILEWIQTDLVHNMGVAPNAKICTALCCWSYWHLTRGYLDPCDADHALHAMTVTCKAGSLAAAPYLIMAAEFHRGGILPGTLSRLFAQCWLPLQSRFTSTFVDAYHPEAPVLLRVYDRRYGLLLVCV